MLGTWKVLFKVFIMAVMLDCVQRTNRIALSRLAKPAGRSGQVMMLS